MKLEKAKSFLRKKITVNDAAIKEARKNGDLNLIELTNDLDTESKSIEKVLQALDDSICKSKIRKFIEENSYKDTYNFKTVEVNKLYELLEDK